MKRIVLYLIVLLCCPHVWAQHMDFCGVELTGTIRNVSDKMRKAGFKLKEKRTDDCFYIFESICKENKRFFCHIHNNLLFRPDSLSYAIYYTLYKAESLLSHHENRLPNIPKDDIMSLIKQSGRVILSVC